jgi:hypothetical protein
MMNFVYLLRGLAYVATYTTNSNSTTRLENAVTVHRNKGRIRERTTVTTTTITTAVETGNRRDVRAFCEEELGNDTNLTFQ